MGISFLFLFITVGWTAALFLASLLAIRGKRFWGSSMMFIGSSCMLVALLSAGGLFLYGTFGDSPLMLQHIAYEVGRGAGILAGIGLLITTIGLVGVSARFGQAERRADEMEGFVEQMKQRMDSLPPQQ